MFTDSINRKVVLFSIMMFVGTSNIVFAATDGSVGANSTGTTDISLTISDLIRVFNMNDIALGTWSGTGDATGSDAICVYDNSGGTYNATFTGSGDLSAFTLSDGTNTIPYTVSYDDGAAADSVTSNTALACANAHQTSFTCNGGTNGTIAVTVSEADMAGSVASAYTGTLTLVVAPL